MSGDEKTADENKRAALAKIPTATLADDVKFLLRTGQDSALMFSSMLLVLQHFVREKCDGEMIDSEKLEKDWDALAEKFTEHADWIKAQVEEAGDGCRKK